MRSVPGPNIRKEKCSSLSRNKLEASVTPTVGDATISSPNICLATRCPILINGLSPVVNTGSKSKYKSSSNCPPCLLTSSKYVLNSDLTFRYQILESF